jgi:nucleoside-diphosphate-sugar epimerase
MNEPTLHVVLGNGQIGALVASDLLARGARVRIVRRGPAGQARERLEWASGDLSDRAFARSVGAGAAVVYDCTNPAYDRWGTDFFPLARGAMDAASVANAKLVVLDNLYMYGVPVGLIREDSPIAPRSRKGELRAWLAEERVAGHARGDYRLTTARASDFFGPGVVRQTTFGQPFYERVFAGKSAHCLGDPGAPHSLAYPVDVARALVTLGERDEAIGAVWHVPHNAAEGMRQTTERLAAALGRTIPITKVPRVVLRGLGLFNSILREVAEMAHQWDAPYVVDDSRYRAAFGESPTPIDEVMRATARWASATFGPSAQPAPVVVGSA